MTVGSRSIVAASADGGALAAPRQTSLVGRARSALGAIVVVARFEFAMWARANGVTNNVRAASTILLVMVVSSGAMLVLLLVAIAAVVRILSVAITPFLPVVALVAEVLMALTALSAVSGSARVQAHLTPFSRLLFDGLRVAPRASLFVRGQLRPLLRVAAIAVIALTVTISGPADVATVGGVLLVGVAAVLLIAVGVSRAPTKMHSFPVAVALAVGCGAAAGFFLSTLNPVALLALDVEELFRFVTDQLRSASSFSPAAIAAVLVTDALALRFGRATGVESALRRVHGWPSAFVALVTRSVGRGSIILRRTLRPLCLLSSAVLAAGLAGTGALAGVAPGTTAIALLPLVVASIVSATASTFLTPLHVLPLFALAARSAPRSIPVAVAVYGVTLTVVVAAPTLVLGAGVSLLRFDPTPLLVAVVTSFGAVAGLILCPFADSGVQRLPDGTIELSIHGHLVSGAPPLLGALAVTFSPLAVAPAVLLASVGAAAVALVFLRRKVHVL